MLIVGALIVTVVVVASRKLGLERAGALLMAFGLAALVPLVFGTAARAAIVATVPMGTAAEYSVLAGSAVSNTGDTTLNGSLGLHPGTAVTGFPPGEVVAPATMQVDNEVALQAKSDLVVAYDNAAGRPVGEVTAADLTGLTLVGGVYAGPDHGALGLSGPLVLDGQGNPSSVFIFQTDSTLITESSSTVSLINGAQECNVFWQVGSSATLGTNSVFRGTILALESITVTTGVTVHGRALARTSAVTLDTNTFVVPLCDLTTTTSVDATTSTAEVTTTTDAGTTTTEAATTTTEPAVTTTTEAVVTTIPDAATTTSAAGIPTPSTGPSLIPGQISSTASTPPQRATTINGGSGRPELSTSTRAPSAPLPHLPVTGMRGPGPMILACIALVIGAAALGAGRLARNRERPPTGLRRPSSS